MWRSVPMRLGRPPREGFPSLSITANICGPSSEGRLVDVAAHKWGADAVDEELVRLIERRARQGEVDLDELEPGYIESVRRYNAREEEERRQAWASYHEQQAERHRRTLQELISYHETQAQTLLTEGSA
jgi:hypothetical protein